MVFVLVLPPMWVVLLTQTPWPLARLLEGAWLAGRVARE